MQTSPASSAHPLGPPYCKSESLSVLRKSCLARSRISGSSLKAGRAKSGGQAQWLRHAGPSAAPASVHILSHVVPGQACALCAVPTPLERRENNSRSKSPSRLGAHGKMGPAEACALCCLPGGPQTDSGAGKGGSSSLDILADLALQPLPPLLQLLDGAFLWELVRGASELTLSQ